MGEGSGLASCGSSGRMKKVGDWDSQSFCQMSDGVKAARDVVINHGRAASEYAQQKTWGEERGEERVRGVKGWSRPCRLEQ